MKRKCRQDKIFFSQNPDEVNKNRGRIFADQYYQLINIPNLITANSTSRVCAICFENQPISYIDIVDIDYYFYTLAEERELKLRELGV